MKYCQTCGAEVNENAVVCTQCGCAIPQQSNTSDGTDGLATASKVFMILGCIAQGWLLLPLAWCLPITISVCGKMKRGEKIGTGLKICTLLFVNLIAGILLLCRSDDK